LQGISPEIIRGFKKFYISEKMDGKEDEEEVGNVGRRHKMGIVDTEAEA
jgi:hypothetical protein